MKNIKLLALATCCTDGIKFVVEGRDRGIGPRN